MRKVVINRDTSETQITIELNLDGTGKTEFDTGLPFLEHMLDQIGRHGMIDLSIRAKGDLHIDDHHTIEDIGISLGEALNEAVGDKKGIKRYGYSYVPLDEALSRVVLDFSGRPGLHMKVDFVSEDVGGIDVNMFEHFFQSLSNHAFLTLHIENFSGENTHHQIETIFKAFGRAMRMAVEIDEKQQNIIPSTKGAL
ncbi:imidazoleglycerol-phosphate dehydratase HisB [Gammaproteobacteria bacterium]|nr:imidazoleglycerol-phosphate dehydratase HisB [Gammaproteobacteria bacterium]